VAKVVVLESVAEVDDVVGVVDAFRVPLWCFGRNAAGAGRERGDGDGVGYRDGCVSEYLRKSMWQTARQQVTAGQVID